MSSFFLSFILSFFIFPLTLFLSFPNSFFLTFSQYFIYCLEHPNTVTFPSKNICLLPINCICDGKASCVKTDEEQIYIKPNPAFQIKNTVKNCKPENTFLKCIRGKSEFLQHLATKSQDHQFPVTMKTSRSAQETQKKRKLVWIPQYVSANYIVPG